MVGWRPCTMVGERRDDPFWGSGYGAIAGCHSRVPFRCAIVMDVVPLLGVIAIAICHCNVLWWGARVTTIFGRVDVVRLLGAIASYQSLFQMFLLFSGPPISPSHPRKRQWILSWASYRFYTVLYIDTRNLVFAIWGLCWYNSKFFFESDLL